MVRTEYNEPWQAKKVSGTYYTIVDSVGNNVFDFGMADRAIECVNVCEGRSVEEIKAALSLLDTQTKQMREFGLIAASEGECIP